MRILALVACLPACLVVAFTSSVVAIAAELKVETDEQGVLVKEGDAPVLFYQRHPKALDDGSYRRANYVHPLYSLDGQVLTEDFPADHLHHRGIFWAWHQVWVGDKRAGDPWVARDFAWDVKDVNVSEASDGPLELNAVVHWSSPHWTDPSGTPKPLVNEQTTIRIHPAREDARAIDFEIRLLALQEDVRLGGSEDEKGYGGFSVRVRLPEDVRFTGRAGEVEPKVLAVEAGPWLDVSGTYGEGDVSGVTILAHPSLPEFPPMWILRRSRSMQNPVFPGRHAVQLSTEQATVLRYRLMVHRGSVDAAQAEAWQQQYVGDE